MASFEYNNIKHEFKSLNSSDVLIQRMGTYKTFYEINLLNKIKSLNLSGTYIDGGANIGNHSVFFDKHCNSEKVISFEIHPDIYNILVDNLNSNDCKKTTPINVGLGEQERLVKLSELCDTNIGMTHIIEGEGDVLIKSLDNLLSDVENITLIKLDVEGYELNALIGMKTIIDKFKPLIIAEMANETLFNNFNNEISKYGYKTDKINYGMTPTYIWTV
jgi:FkbM family methyltransferase